MPFKDKQDNGAESCNATMRLQDMPAKSSARRPGIIF